MEAGALLSLEDRKRLELTLDDLEVLVEPELSIEWEGIISHLEYLENRDNRAKRKEYPLAPEYEEDTISKYPDIYRYALINSMEMAVGEATLKSPEWLDNLSARKRIAHAVKTYRLFTGTHTFHNRVDTLVAITKELEENLAIASSTPPELETTECSPVTMWHQRVLANGLEELADITGDTIYVDKAHEINKSIVGTAEIPWHSGFKVHALFAQYDSLFRHIISDINHNAQNDAQLCFYQDIIRVAEEMTAQSKAEGSPELKGAGSLFEALYVGMLRDEVLRLSLKTKVRSAYVREDHSLFIQDPESSKPNPLRVPNISFDVVMYKPSERPNFLRRINIELKKGVSGTSPRLLPGIVGVKAKHNGLSGYDFANRTIDYARGQINLRSDKTITTTQQKAIDDLSKNFNIDEIFHRHYYRRPDITKT